MRSRTILAITLIVALGLVLGIVGQAKAFNVLVYDDNTVNQRAQAALNSLAMPYTVGNSATFNTLLLGGGWNLVVVDCPSNTPASWTPLINYIGGGGRVIMSFWDLDNSAGVGDPALPGAFDVSVTADFLTPQNVYRWNPGHPIFNNPNAVGNLTSWDDTYWVDDGDELAVLAGGVAVAGFATVPTSGRAAIVLGNGGRTIYNGFLFDELNDPTGTNLIANEITYMIPEPGTMALVGLGLLGLLIRRRR